MFKTWEVSPRGCEWRAKRWEGFDLHSNLLGFANDDLRTTSTHCQCAHIFPESTKLSLEPGSSEICPFFLLFITLNGNYLFSVFTLPPRCGLLWNALAKKNHSDELNGSKIHRLKNGCGCWFSKSIRPIKSLVCSNCASELTILDCLTTLTLGRMKRINTSSNPHSSVSYASITNM